MAFIFPAIALATFGLALFLRRLLRKPGHLTTASPNQDVPILGLRDDYRLADASVRLLSGFTVGQVRALGSFPDYAKLSGVPLPSAVSASFRIEDAAPRPYRPLRWPYHQTMALQKLDPDYWLELESTYRSRIRQRQDLHAQHGSDILNSLPGSELAQRELMEMALQFLCARYPQYFELRGQTFVNRLLATEHHLDRVSPLKVLLDNVPEDFAIMMRDERTGRYVLRAGVICSTIGWHIGQKMGMGLSEIHGEVPDFEEKLSLSVDRFFNRLPADSPVSRGSWSLETGSPLFLPPTDPNLQLRKSQDAKLRIEDVTLRVDWQTLRRLPLSSAVVFNFKALFTPLPRLRHEPYVPALLLRILEGGKDSLMAYKGSWHVEHLVRPVLGGVGEGAG
ncbi:HRQ family protein [Ophiocordyceps camponoti-floridani]|uniref:HRQ family protein n=1 Tax=Ophiocordyceps camponoti-floridani TaxID=2030778 RepID=A0A8H4Q7Z2_9HYPO|nr:HRQ family protein [Ophiocordyceps camponoti-floridani]